MRRLVACFLVLCVAVSAGGCATTPVGVERVGLREAYRDINRTALNDKVSSGDTKVVLHRYGLTAQFENDPASAIAALVARSIAEDDRRDLRFAIAELSFLLADTLEGSEDPDSAMKPSDYYLLSATSAYFYLLGESREAAPDPYDRRFRVACDLYNRALGKAFVTKTGGRRVEFKKGEDVRKMPSGFVSLVVDTKALPWSLDTFESFLLADDFAVRGLTVRNRTPGLGVPLIAVQKKSPGVPREAAVPVTAFMRFVRAPATDNGFRMVGTIELHSAYEGQEVDVRGQKVPLETDSTAPLAWMLSDPSVWKSGVRRFLKLDRRSESGVRTIEPYLPGRIPVVFVHGTASSPVWWAEMINTLNADPVLRKRYQFWFFQYNSSLPIVVSAAELRKSLTEMVHRLDPDRRDPALRKMVVVGHSQGGLLTKMSVVRTEDRLWKAFSDEPLESASIDDELKPRMQEYLFIEPLPFVSRVVFISTPHRGSYRASGWVRNLIRRIVTLPIEIVEGTTEVLRLTKDSTKLPWDIRGKVPTSVDGMSPENPLLQALVAMPVAQGVTAHSIIPVLGEGDYREGNDGVVEYRSAHVDGVASEFVLRDGHSCQGNPLTIEEVRRILLEHSTPY